MAHTKITATVSDEQADKKFTQGVDVFKSIEQDQLTYLMEAIRCTIQHDLPLYDLVSDGVEKIMKDEFEKLKQQSKERGVVLHPRLT